MRDRRLQRIGLMCIGGIKWALLALATIAFLFPFYWAAMTSFKPSTELVAMPPIFFPRQPVGFENYRQALRDIPMFLYYRNSLLVGSAVTLSVLVSSLLAGYIFAKFNFFGKNILFGTILSTMMIPFQVVLIPIYLLFNDLGLLDSLWGVIIPSLVSGYGIFLMRQFMKSIPNDLIDAARIDGSSEYGIFLRIVAPLCKPALSALGIFTFMASWDSFLWPMLVLQDSTKFTLPIGLNMYGSGLITGVYDHLVSAAAVMAMLPVLVVFLFAQRYFVQGITLTGMKG